MLSKEQVDYLSSINYINNIDGKVQVVSNYEVLYLPATRNVIGKVLLILKVFYLGSKVTDLSFNLQNYKYDELIEIAKNIRNNEFIMYELDQALSGEIE